MQIMYDNASGLTANKISSDIYFYADKVNIITL